MTMFNKDQIFQLLESRDGEALRALWQGRGAVDIAALLDSVEDGARQAAVFRTLPKDLAADVFSYLPGPTQATLARSFADGELQQIFDALHLDDAADFLEELPANLVTRILRSASPQRRMAVNALLRYPADSAGSVMTPEFVSLRPGDTVRQARYHPPHRIHKETVYTCYVLEHRQLLGVVSAKDLLTAAGGCRCGGPDGHGCGICGYAHRPGRGRPAPGEI
ncbi:MAG: magnesium transporter MgtE N-terminal domain-containing protein [Dysosmobacter welbionis]